MVDQRVGALARNWEMVALRGGAALLFGRPARLVPAASLTALVVIFGACSIADGVLTILVAVANGHGEPHWVALLVGGVLSVAIGAIAFLMPGATAVARVYLIAGRAIVTAVHLRKLITDEWVLVLTGVLSVAFGIALVMYPGAAALAVMVSIGCNSAATGVLLVALALRLRSSATTPGATHAAREPAPRGSSGPRAAGYVPACRAFLPFH
jgi:uncharacterized membrane protein HdeD (DUF308 family)